MAIEIPNVFEAGGIFLGEDPVPPPFTIPIVNAAGVQPFDPATSPLVPLGGFTRANPGVYLVRLIRSIDFLEGIAIATCTASIFGDVCCQIGTPSGNNPDGDGQVGVFEATNTDVNFQMGVFRMSYGEDSQA